MGRAHVHAIEAMSLGLMVLQDLCLLGLGNLAIPIRSKCSTANGVSMREVAVNQEIVEGRSIDLIPPPIACDFARQLLDSHRLIPESSIASS